MSKAKSGMADVTVEMADATVASMLKTDSQSSVGADSYREVSRQILLDIPVKQWPPLISLSAQRLSFADKEQDFVNFIVSCISATRDSEEKGLVERKSTILFECVKLCVHNKVDEAVASRLVDIISLELPYLEMSEWAIMCNTIVRNIYRAVSSKEILSSFSISDSFSLLPQLFKFVRNAPPEFSLLDESSGKELSGEEFVDDVVSRRILGLNTWGNLRVPLATLMESIDFLSEERAKSLSEKLLSELSRAPLTDCPSLIHHMLKIAKRKGQRSTILLGICKFFSRKLGEGQGEGEGEESVSSTSVSPLLSSVMGTVLITISLALRQDSELAFVVQKLSKSREKSAWSPFTLSIMLSMSHISRYEKVLSNIKSVLIESFCLKSRFLSAGWTDEFRDRILDISPHLLDIVSLSTSGWEDLLPSLVKFGFMCVDYGIGEYNAHTDDRAVLFTHVDTIAMSMLDLGSELLTRVFASHPSTRNVILIELSARIVSISPQHISESAAHPRTLVSLLSLLSNSLASIIKTPFSINSVLKDHYIDILPLVTPEIAKAIVSALIPALKLLPDTVDSLLLTLRKSAFSSTLTIRQTAMSALIPLFALPSLGSTISLMLSRGVNSRGQGSVMREIFRGLTDSVMRRDGVSVDDVIEIAMAKVSKCVLLESSGEDESESSFSIPFSLSSLLHEGIALDSLLSTLLSLSLPTIAAPDPQAAVNLRPFFTSLASSICAHDLQDFDIDKSVLLPSKEREGAETPTSPAKENANYFLSIVSIVIASQLLPRPLDSQNVEKASLLLLKWRSVNTMLGSPFPDGSLVFLPSLALIFDSFANFVSDSLLKEALDRGLIEWCLSLLSSHLSYFYTTSRYFPPMLPPLTPECSLGHLASNICRIGTTSSGTGIWRVVDGCLKVELCRLSSLGENDLRSRLCLLENIDFYSIFQSVASPASLSSLSSEVVSWFNSSRREVDESEPGNTCPPAFRLACCLLIVHSKAMDGNRLANDDIESLMEIYEMFVSDISRYVEGGGENENENDETISPMGIHVSILAHILQSGRGNPSQCKAVLNGMLRIDRLWGPDEPGEGNECGGVYQTQRNVNQFAADLFGIGRKVKLASLREGGEESDEEELEKDLESVGPLLPITFGFLPLGDKAIPPLLKMLIEWCRTSLDEIESALLICRRSPIPELRLLSLLESRLLLILSPLKHILKLRIGKRGMEISTLQVQISLRVYKMLLQCVRHRANLMKDFAILPSAIFVDLIAEIHSDFTNPVYDVILAGSAGETTNSALLTTRVRYFPPLVEAIERWEIAILALRSKCDIPKLTAGMHRSSSRGFKIKMKNVTEEQIGAEKARADKKKRTNVGSVGKKKKSKLG